MPTVQDWRAQVERDLKGADFDKRLVKPTHEGLTYQPLYTEAPQGPRADRGSGWQLRVPVSSLEEAREALEGGADALAPTRPIEGLDELGLPVIPQGIEVLAGQPLPDPPRPLRIDATRFHEGGGSDAQCLGVLLAGGLYALRQAEDRGWDLQETVDHLELHIGLDPSLFRGLCKVRAARMMWAAVLADCGLEPTSLLVVRPSNRTWGVCDPWVNLLRNTAVVWAGAIGGADAIVSWPYDLLTGASDLGRRVARNTQHVLRLEAGLDRVQDPAAGSYALESLTHQLAEAAWEELQRLEAEGLAESLRSERFFERIEAVAAARDQDVDRRRLPLLGITEFPNLGEPLAKQPIDARFGGPFERMRAASEAFLADSGRRPTVTLATLGPLAEHNARATWMENLFAAGGIAVRRCEAATASGELVCLVGRDSRYAEQAASITHRLAEQGSTVWLAGKPRQDAGPVDHFAHLGANVNALLESAWEVLA
jgi:methylmalonyl-CoA mutase